MSGEEFTIVFVRGFGETLTDEYFITWFEKYCDGVKHAEVAKDCFGKPLGYGYVSFYTHNDAEEAIRNTDGKKLRGRTLKVEAFKKSRVHREISNRNVFVKGFGDTFDKKELRVYFRDHVGDVESVEVAKDENGVSRGYGYVSFYKYQDAVEAVRKLDGKKVNGKTLTVEFFKPKDKRRPNPCCNIFVQGFPEILDDEDFKELFEIFGEVQSAKVVKDIDGRSKCYGYVSFSRSQDAETAIRRMDGYTMGSNVLKVGPFQTMEDRQKNLRNRNLHILNLHESINDEELRKIFEPYGMVLSSSIARSPIRGKNQGFVRFKTVDEADSAVSDLDHKIYKGLSLRVCVQAKKTPTKTTKVTNFTTSGRQSWECPEQFRTPRVPDSMKNTFKSKSMGNLNCNIFKSRIAANFTQNQSYKTSGKGATNVRCLDEKFSLEKSSMHRMLPTLVEDRNQDDSGSVRKNAGGKTVIKAVWNAS